MNEIETGKLVCRILSSETLNKRLISTLSSFTDADWNDVHRFAEPIKLLPIIYYKLKNFFEISTIPTNINQKIQQAYIASSGQSLKIQHQLNEILESLNKEKIEVIVLKGAYLCNKYYSYPALRPMSDIDILVRLEDIQKAYTNLTNLGYSASKEFKPEVVDLYRKHIPPLCSDNKYPIEVHKELVQPRKGYLGNIESNDIWENASRATLLNYEINIMKPEHLVIYLAYSIAEDDFKYKTLHLYDIFLIISQEAIDWDYMIQQAENWKATKPLLCTLLLLKNNFSMQYDYPVIEKLNKRSNIPDKIKDFGAQLDTVVFESSEESDIDKKRINEYCSHFGFWDTFRFASKILFSHRWYIYKYGLKNDKKLFLHYRIQAIREVLNGYFKPFIKHVLCGKRVSLQGSGKKHNSKDFFSWLQNQD